MSDSPLISVVMPVYNAERYVSEAIKSILNQTYPHFEFIIVDDGSTDDSTGIIRYWEQRDDRILSIFLAHSGRGKARNEGIFKARGDYIAFLDSDDIALPDRLTVQLEWMQRTGVEVCGSCVKVFGEESKIYWVPETHRAIVNELLFGLALFLSSVTMRTEISKYHLFRENTSFEDYEYWTRLASLYRMGNVPAVLIKNRRHANQSHIIEAAGFGNDLRKYSLAYLHTLFPEVSTTDNTVIAHIVQKKPLDSLQDLELAGLWLVRLANTPDNFLRQRMAERWLGACRRSAHLGWGSYRLYRQVCPRFDVPEDKRVMFTLQLACALRIRTDSWIYNILGHLKGGLRRRKRSPSTRKSRP